MVTSVKKRKRARRGDKSSAGSILVTTSEDLTVLRRVRVGVNRRRDQQSSHGVFLPGV